MRSTTTSALLGAFQGLRISPACPSLRPSLAARLPTTTTTTTPRIAALPSHVRLFSATAAQAGSWLEPNLNRKNKMMKGRPRVHTGGSSRGTTVIWGEYGLRMTDHHRRISAAQFKVAQDTIKARLRGQKYRLYTRVACNVGVYTSGNEMRMGKGKGSFDHWAARVALNRIVFEIKGQVHEAVIRDAFRLAGQKLPGQWETIRKGDPACVGMTKLDGITLEELRRPRKKLEVPIELADATSSSPAAPSP